MALRSIFNGYFFLFHNVPEKLAKGETAFTFVTDVESALAQAKAVVGDKHGVIGVGANTA